MNWNYRLMKREYLNPINQEKEVIYGIHEVYYDEDGNPNGWSKEPENISSETIEGIQWQIEKFQEALTKPLLDYSDERSKTSNCDEKRLEDAKG